MVCNPKVGSQLEPKTQQGFKGWSWSVTLYQLDGEAEECNRDEAM